MLEGWALTIVYATETGNAEEIAYSICSKLLAIDRSCRVDVLSIGEYDVARLPSERTIVFVVSTCGDGDVPSAMKPLWSFLLRKSLSSTSLEQVQFAVFGLGDSSYEKYNAVARKLERRLTQLGGCMLLATGLGDDQAKYGYYSAYQGWLQRLVMCLQDKQYVKKSTAHELSMDPEGDLARQSNYAVEVVSEPSSTGATSGDSYISTMRQLHGDAYESIVVQNIRLTDAKWDQDVRNLQLCIDKRPMTDEDSSCDSVYSIGDVAEVFYRNTPHVVDRISRVMQQLASCIGIQATSILDISIKDFSKLRPSRICSAIQCSCEQLFRDVLDIGSIPKRSFFESLAHFACNTEERNKLLELASPEGTDLYFDYCIRERKSYVEVLEEFPSARPPLHVLLDLIPVAAPRQYSVASSPLVSPRRLDLCIAVVQRRTPYGRNRVGLCSGFISTLVPGDKVLVRFKRGLIHNSPILSEDPALSKKLVLVGPGTGIAPMRALVQHHLMRYSLRTNEGSLPSIILFFGCRRRRKDYLYGDEWESISQGVNPYRREEQLCEEAVFGSDLNADSIRGQHQHHLSVLVDTAFSQDQPDKDYVTHHMVHRGAFLSDMLLQRDCSVFVSGSAKRMPSDVRKTLVGILKTHTYLGTDDDSGSFLSKLTNSKRYIVEAWS